MKRVLTRSCLAPTVPTTRSPRRKPGDSGWSHRTACHADLGASNKPVSPGFHPGLFDTHLFLLFWRCVMNRKHFVNRGFNYVGVRQAWRYFCMAHLLGSRRSRGAQALPQPERNASAGGPWRWILGLVSTSKQPQRGHSTIRVREDMPRSHEITYGRIGAHSHSRDLTGEAVSHKTRRATEPRSLLRGPVITQSSGREWFAGLVRFVLSYEGPHQDQELPKDCARARRPWSPCSCRSPPPAAGSLRSFRFRAA